MNGVTCWLFLLLLLGVVYSQLESENFHTTSNNNEKDNDNNELTVETDTKSDEVNYFVSNDEPATTQAEIEVDAVETEDSEENDTDIEEKTTEKEEETSSILQILYDILPFDEYAEKILSKVKNSAQQDNSSASNDTKTNNDTASPSSSVLPPSSSSSSSSPSPDPNAHSAEDDNVIYGISDSSVPSLLLKASILPHSSILSVLSNVRDKFNYASMDCGANVLSVNREAKEATSILVGSKDRYMLNPCGASKRFVVLELCEEIGIQIIALANYEFFSSMLKGFEVFGTNRYPSKQWTPMGNFTAQNVRRLQYFVLPEPSWFKYIKIQFNTHYGDEHYCPISELRVHGTTVVDDITQQIERDSREISELANALRSPHRNYNPPPSLPTSHELNTVSNYHPPIHRHTSEPDDDDDDDPVDSSKDWDSMFSDTGNMFKGLGNTLKESIQKIRDYRGFEGVHQETGPENEMYECDCDIDGGCSCEIEVASSYHHTDQERIESEQSSNNMPAPKPTLEPQTTSPSDHVVTQDLPPTGQDIPNLDTNNNYPTDILVKQGNPTPPIAQADIAQVATKIINVDSGLPITSPNGPRTEQGHITSEHGNQNSDITQINQEPVSTGNIEKNLKDESEISTPEIHLDPAINISHEVVVEQNGQAQVRDLTKEGTLSDVDHIIDSSTVAKIDSEDKGEFPSFSPTCSNGQIFLEQSPLVDDMCYINLTAPHIIKHCNIEYDLPENTQQKIEVPSKDSSPPPDPPTISTPPTHPHSQHNSISPHNSQKTRLENKQRKNSQEQHTGEKYSNLGFALGSSPQTIFKTLITRIKTLEINQSIAAVYLADLTSSYAEAFSSMDNTFSRIDQSNANLLKLIQSTSKKNSEKQKALSNEVEELRAERIHMLSNISMLAHEMRVLSETTIALQSQQETQRWIDIIIAGVIGALIVIVARRGNNDNGSNTIKQKTRPPTSPVMRLSRSVGGGLNMLQNPEQGTPPKRRRRHSLGHSLSPSLRNRKQLSFMNEDSPSSGSNSDLEMDADDEFSKKYFHNSDSESDDELELELEQQQLKEKGGITKIKDRVLPYLIRKSASTTTMDHKYEPDLLRFLFM